MEQLLKLLTRHRQLVAVSALCLTAVGVGGWFLLKEEPSAPLTELPVQAEVSAPVPDIPVLPEPLPAPPAEEAAKPVILPEETPQEEMPQEEAPPPAPPAETIPVVAQPPQLVVSPLNGTILTAFSVDELLYSETFEDWRTHDGLDIAAEAGTTVLSASSGTVLSVAQDDMMGTTVIIDHGNGYQTTYANLQSRPTVEAGERVSAGQIIGAVGTTAAAESAQGPHLHFSVSLHGDVVDPNEYLAQ